MDLQPKIEPESPAVFDSNGRRNMNDEIISISGIVSAMRASFDRFEEALLATDAKHKSEIGPLQEKFELERLIRLQAEEELKRARENYEALLKKVKESGFCNGNGTEESKNKNPEMKRKRVDDNDNSSNNVIAELRNRVAELEDANNKHLETIGKLSAEITKLRHEKNTNADAELLGNTEGEPQAVSLSNIDVGHFLGASEMADRGTPLGGHRDQPEKVNISSSRGRDTPSTTIPFPTAVTPSSGTSTAHTSATPSSAPTLKGEQPNCIRFDGKKGWKPPSRGLHRVTEVIQTMHDAPYKSFTDVPKATRDMWWREWKKDYHIYPEEEGLIKGAFMYRCGKRMREMYREIRIGKGSHHWMNDAHLRVLREYWETEEFKVTQEKAKANRASLKGGSLHTGGSSTIEGTRARMTRELQRPPTQSELFMKTHMKKSKSGHEWVDVRSEQTYTMYQQRLEEAQLKHQTQVDAGEDPDPINEELIWLQTVGGPYKGRIYGTGHY